MTASCSCCMLYLDPVFSMACIFCSLSPVMKHVKSCDHTVKTQTCYVFSQCRLFFFSPHCPAGKQVLLYIWMFALWRLCQNISWDTGKYPSGIGICRFCFRIFWLCFYIAINTLFLSGHILKKLFIKKELQTIYNSKLKPLTRRQALVESITN